MNIAMTIGESVDYPVLRCDACGIDYILIAVLGLKVGIPVEKEVPEEDRHDIGLMSQARTYFCPYCGCGKDQKKEAENEKICDHRVMAENS